MNGVITNKSAVQADLVPGALYSAHSLAAVADLLERWRPLLCRFDPEAAQHITRLQVIIDLGFKDGICQ